MPTDDYSNFARIRRRTGLAMANFHTANPYLQVGGPQGTSSGIRTVSRNGNGLFIRDGEVIVDTIPPPVTPPTPPTPGLTFRSGSLVWSGSYWLNTRVATNDTIVIEKSDDGLSWDPQTHGFTLQPTLTWNGSYWVGYTSPSVGFKMGSSYNSIRLPLDPLDKLLAPSSSSFIAKSSNGLQWDQASVNPFARASNVVWNGSYWLAFNTPEVDPASFVKSDDGDVWTVVTGTSQFDTVSSLSWSGSYWLGAGSTGLNSMGGSSYVVATSTDGSGWTVQPDNPFNLGSSQMVYNGTGWLGFGENDISGFVFGFSPNGVDWEKYVDTNDFPLVSCNILRWCDTYWIAAGLNSQDEITLQTSGNGQSWTDLSGHPFTASCEILVWNGSYLLGYGTDSGAAGGGGPAPILEAAPQTFAGPGPGTTAGFLAKSNADGSVWAIPENPFTGSLSSLVWNGTYWLGTGTDTNGAIVNSKSSDGVSWDPPPPVILPTFTSIYSDSDSVKMGFGPIDGPGASSEMFLLVNGGSGWTDITRPNSAGIFALATDGDKWMVSYQANIGNVFSNKVDITPDAGVTWETLTTPFSGGCFPLISHNQYWFGVNPDKDSVFLARGITDGTSWTDLSGSPGYPFTNTFDILVSNGSYLLGVGSDDNDIVMAKSTTNGNSWTPITHPFIEIYTLEYDNNIWLGGGIDVNGPIVAYGDASGSIWTTINHPFTSSCNLLVSSGSYWLGAGVLIDDSVILAKKVDPTDTNTAWITLTGHPFTNLCKSLLYDSNGWYGSGTQVGPEPDFTVTTVNATSTNGVAWTIV